MSNIKAIKFLLALCSLGFWFYLLSLILNLIEATELMWFVFYMYIIFAFVFTILKELAEEEK